jgi:transcriptional regulator with XRE-family HTH domain
MENILMRFCRETNRYTVKTVATKLGVSVDDYIGIETGEILLTEEQAKILGKLYNAHTSYFKDEATQLGLLRTKIEIIKALKSKISSLERLNK